jgi:hypothetical protein
MNNTGLRDQYRKSLANHQVFEVVTSPGQVALFYLAKPREKGPSTFELLESTMLVFTQKGIGIAGDLCPEAGTNGVWSNPGYDLEWFCRVDDGSYLCSKFLRKGYSHRAAFQWAQSRVTELENELGENDPIKRSDDPEEIQRHLDAYREAVEQGRNGEVFHDPRAFNELLEECADYDAITDGVAMDYDDRSAALLTAIQERFAASWKEKYGPVKPSSEAERSDAQDSGKGGNK